MVPEPIRFLKYFAQLAHPVRYCSYQPDLLDIDSATWKIRDPLMQPARGLVLESTSHLKAIYSALKNRKLLYLYLSLYIRMGDVWY